LPTVSSHHPYLVSIGVSPYVELARWLLDRLGIPYHEESHVPVFHVLPARRHGGSSVVPVLDIAETTLTDARQVVNYYEARCPANRKLYPVDSQTRAATQELFDLFFDKLGVSVRAWAYAYLLPVNRKAVLRVWGEGAPWYERALAPFVYPLLVKAMRRSLLLQPDTVAQQRIEIDAILDRVEALLADKRRFLMGDQFTAADLALATLAAPLVLPAEYHGPAPTLAELPAGMRADVELLRARPAGQFILRLYREERSQPAPDLVAGGAHQPGNRLKDKAFSAVTSPGLLRPVFNILRRSFPILKLGKSVIVTRHSDVVEVLSRDTDFTIAEINEARFNQSAGPFILGMDRSPQYDTELAVLRQAVRPDDLNRIRDLVKKNANDLATAARPQGKIDVVNGLARVVAIRTVDAYFGIPAPDEPTMMRWMRDVFHDLFANPGSDAAVHRDALRSSQELREHMDRVIARRKTQLSEPDQPDDVLGRLLLLQQKTENSWLDDRAVQRNLGGLIVGAVDTTSKFVTLAIDELLRRPDALAGVRAAALADDVRLVQNYAYEAVRFNPHHPVQARFCKKETEVAAGTSRARKIAAGSSVFVATLSAMFDPEVFVEPGTFRADRDTEYLHFGYGMHRCFGRAINGVQIPELVATLVRLPNLRRDAGSTGRIAWDGPFPERLILRFDHD
jgi:cytochrome P450/glutathione S-transferase